jgi:hypothetical protein
MIVATGFYNVHYQNLEQLMMRKMWMSLKK